MSRPRVAIDGRPLQGKPLGVMRYLNGVLPVLAEHLDIFVLLDARRPLPTTPFPGRIEWVHLGCPPGLPGLAWLEVAVVPWLRRSNCIFHGTFNVLPLSYGGRSILTIHDLAPQLHSEDFRSLKRAVWRMNMRIGVGRAYARHYGFPFRQGRDRHALRAGAGICVGRAGRVGPRVLTGASGRCARIAKAAGRQPALHRGSGWSTTARTAGGDRSLARAKPTAPRCLSASNWS